VTTEHGPLAGIHYDSLEPVGASATLDINATGASVTARGATRHYGLSTLRVSPRIGRADRFIALPDGGQFQCPDNPRLDALPQPRTEGLAAWFEARALLAALGVILIAAGLLVGYFRGLPAAAEYIASRVSVENERLIGEKGLAWLDRNKWFQPTSVREDIQAMIREDLDALRRGLAQEAHYEVEFRNAPKLGANALAFPGGIIVVTDGLVQLAGSREELAAVLAHEIGHIEKRHTLRLMLQDSIVVLVVATVVGDAATMGVAGVPAVLAQANYSREFEAEADEFAFALLKKHGVSPEHFATIMVRLAKQTMEAKAKQPVGFLSTHPLTRDRVERARAAAQTGP
jgi:predicted Zn-dependent protease